MRYSIDRDHWARLTFTEQMANISSEVGRSLAARRRGDREAADAAFRRGMDLISATIECLPPGPSGDRSQVTQARAQYVRAVSADVIDEEAASELEAYFHAFALEARRDR